MLADKCYQLMDKGPVRALILILALVMAGCVMWDPSQFAANTSSFKIWQGIILIWATCAAVIFGVGFRPHKLIWRVIFHPLIAAIILIWGLFRFFS
ncbi:cyd operon protein YbgE [Moellerella wisconsensis]|uniref:YbgE family protein n=3 Tax=Moellerella wisconsensis TaxID=158849 RepID=A0A0N0I9K6_9GAMM|nr:cyd operon protein YbgE [Moellerella wisconsensis]KLN97148.1 cytochrome bd biosynthesis protein [Moellerella wisconsensis]KPD02130.1 YbgE family protein [Moellerella wisconsensis ATCC 35017]UNH24904.1 cyd operon protein YbgE [Moellerella wisconsensis]UNH28017.1 cyd operon protein YbgE [Moellerella wisconsensis]UNH31525.1 cyd operon protein YbgE [Moellerella wisconsensis]